MLKLVTDDNAADYTPIIDTIARFISDGDAFAEFFVDRMLDAYADAIHDFYDTECERWERDGDDE